MHRALAYAAVALLGTACLAPPSAAQRLSDAAIEMNTAMRFGRMDIANDYVANVDKDAFVSQHAQWGKHVRIVDVEFSGVRVNERDEADVTIGFVWQFAEDPVMRETRVIQHWKDTRGTWAVVKERTEGDPGLLGQQPARLAVLPPITASRPVAAGASAAPDGAPPPLPVEVATPQAPQPKSQSQRFQTRVIYSPD